MCGWTSRSIPWSAGSRIVAMSGFARRLVVLVLAAPAIAAVPGCSAEKICMPGEVVVQHNTGYTACEQPEPGDSVCASGEIFLKNPDGRKGCIPNRYLPGNYADQLTPTSTT
jgi:hypothetical protein